MAFKVIGRFQNRATGKYIDPGQECPSLSPEDAARLVKAGCLAEVADTPKKPRPKKDASPAAEG